MFSKITEEISIITTGWIQFTFHFYTAPSLSWSAGLKFTKARLEIPHDINIHIFIDKGLRGRLSMIANQYSKANKLEMKEYYDPKLKPSYIFFTDANNLYGWVMSQALPTGGKT